MEKLPTSDRAVPAGWPAFGALTVVGLLAVASLVIDLAMARATGRATEQLTGNSIRSIELAKDLRFHAHRLAEVTHDSREVAKIASEIATGAREYSPLASEPGEREEFDHLQVLLADLRDRADPSLLVPIEGSIEHLVEINERAANSYSADITARDDRLLLTDVLVGVVTIASAIGVSVILARSLRRQRELTREHLALLAERHLDLEAFAARASHDLKGRLSPLRGYADLLQDNESSDARELGRRIRRATDRMNAIVDDMLALSVVGRPLPGKVAVAPALLEVVREFAADLTEADVSVDVGDHFAACSPGILEQAAHNLLSNAIKYRSPDRRLSIKVSGERVSDSIRVVFSDNGIGMDAETMEHAFEPFYRAPGASGSGHGLGLAIVQRVIHGVGGTVSLDAIEGEGTRVTVVLHAA